LLNKHLAQISTLKAKHHITDAKVLVGVISNWRGVRPGGGGVRKN